MSYADRRVSQRNDRSRSSGRGAESTACQSAATGRFIGKSSLAAAAAGDSDTPAFAQTTRCRSILPAAIGKAGSQAGNATGIFRHTIEKVEVPGIIYAQRYSLKGRVRTIENDCASLGLAAGKHAKRDSARQARKPGSAAGFFV
jgi:hypothetical protein